MPLDLYAVYKQFFQRSNRNREDQDLAEMTQIIRDIAQNLYRIKSKREPSKEEIGFAFNSARNLFDLEKNYGRFNTLFSRNLVRALYDNDFVINVPVHRMSLWLENDDHIGTLYVLTSKSRPKQCKLGVTQGDLEERIAKYQYRHQCTVDLYFFRHDIPTPFRYEEAITKKFLAHKNSDNAEGGSNEWFFLEPEKLKKEIVKIKVIKDKSF